MASPQLDVLAFGPHPDDVEIGCGGTLHKLVGEGKRVGIVDLTEGEMGTRGSVAERYEEAAAAAEALGIPVRENLQIPDANIELNRENRQKLVNAIRKYRPSLIFAPYPNDRHPDHVHAGQLIGEAAFYAGLRKYGDTGLQPHRVDRVVFYMVTYEFAPTFLVDISDNFAAKMTSIQAYKTQFYNPDYAADDTFIASKEYLESIEFRARNFGWKGGVKLAEPFWVREALVLDDLVGSLTINKM